MTGSLLGQEPSARLGPLSGDGQSGTSFLDIKAEAFAARYLWHVPLPESVNVWPAMGMNCHE